MDRLIVLEQGRIVEQGSHAELLALGGHYAALWRHQSGGFLSEEVNEGAVLSATTTIASVTLTSVHATRWDDTRFRLQACNAAGCSVGAELDILGQMLPAIGFVEASNAEANDSFGSAVALSADGNTLAVGAGVQDGSSGAVYLY